MVQKIEVEGFDAFVEAVESSKASGKPVFVLFSGSKTAGGVSWCPDCVTAEPVVKGAVDKAAPEDSVFIYVGVGGRDFWKDPNCVFRTDARTKLKSVPTLMKYGTPQRLEEEQCAKVDMVEMLFEDA
ncbi:thioredoxin domain-containing protein 17-like [Penaeus chinensis]|uniref:thioredoxin domain-containing protein 17-like n=1 Tax=Penaeus chinensis TaxID=139456 RepID=UPI001FB67FAC|nr:thioredoxin domain-containing protein 17-like [Penaeus chinensis]